MEHIQVKKIGKVGPISIAITNLNIEEKIVALISSELGLTDSEEEFSTDIELLFVDNISKDIYTAKRYSAKGKLNFNDEACFVGYSNSFDYLLVDLFSKDSPTRIIISTKRNLRQQLSSIKKSLLQPDSSYEHEAAQEIMSYSLFWYVFNIVLLKYNSIFLHAGIFVNKNSKAIALTGTGGGGKTSTLFNVLNDGCEYLAEDFGIISLGNKAYYNPKTISLYNSDILTGQPIFTQFLKNNVTGLKKLQWSISTKILGKNPKLKVLVNDIVPQKPKSDNYEIGAVIYLIRTHLGELNLVDTSVEEMTERVFYSSYREMKSLTEILMLTRANSDLNFYPSESDFGASMRKLYLEIFKNTNNKILYIPHHSTPEEIKNYLSQQGIL